jgi:hypothetical protein
MTILAGYIHNATGGSKRLGMANMARALMKDDPERFKQGYSPENAVLAVAERAGHEGIAVSAADLTAVCSAVGADEATVIRCLADD